jgi:hypothetical protein
MPRFMRKGTTRFYYVPTIANATLNPTTAEVTAGTRLDTVLAEVNGFTFSNDVITTPDMSSTFDATIPGTDTSEDSSLVFYEDKTFASNTAKAALLKGTTGFIVIFFQGVAGVSPAAADRCDVWPILVAANVRLYTAGNEAAQWRADFAATATPQFDRTMT